MKSFKTNIEHAFNSLVPDLVDLSSEIFSYNKMKIFGRNYTRTGFNETVVLLQDVFLKISS